MTDQLDSQSYRILMCVNGQKPRLLATLFSDLRSAESCCRALQKYLPSAQFGVKVFSAIVLVMLSGCSNLRQAVANAAGSPPATSASDQLQPHAGRIGLTLQQARWLMQAYKLPQPDYAVRSLRLRGELPAPNQVSKVADVHEIQGDAGFDRRVQEPQKFVILYRTKGRGTEAYDWYIQ